VDKVGIPGLLDLTFQVLDFMPASQIENCRDSPADCGGFLEVLIGFRCGDIDE
jgi:hypothetical protein